VFIEVLIRAQYRLQTPGGGVEIAEFSEMDRRGTLCMSFGGDTARELPLIRLA
jgi:hypothetical protein